MTQRERNKIEELDTKLEKVIEHQFELSQSLSRVLNLLEGDEKFGIVGYASKINDHEKRLTKIETDKKVFAGKVAVSFVIFSTIGSFVYYLIDKFWNK